jgi:ribosome biogenesis GTPase
MSKRKINQRQSARIEKKQRNYHEQPDGEQHVRRQNGLVIKRYSRHALVEYEPRHEILCAIRPTIQSLVAGDKVIWQSEGENQGVIVSCYPRTCVLERPDKHGQMRPIAANITQAMIVVAPKPDISWLLLDSYLIISHHLNLRACIILNKVDMPCLSLQEALLACYKPLGYDILFMGRNQSQGYTPLQQMLNHQTSVFVGQSGVGKSSLIANILPELAKDIQVGDIAEKSELGCHTTSNSCLYHLPSGGALIDSPGIRELGLWHLPATDIAKHFCEFRPLLSTCRYRNCTHLDAPGCAIISAVKNKQINAKRYESYVKMVAQFAK